MNMVYNYRTPGFNWRDLVILIKYSILPVPAV